MMIKEEDAPKSANNESVLKIKEICVKKAFYQSTLLIVRWNPLLFVYWWCFWGGGLKFSTNLMN